MQRVDAKCPKCGREFGALSGSSLTCPNPQCLHVFTIAGETVVSVGADAVTMMRGECATALVTPDPV